jgi:hypothetical protein
MSAAFFSILLIALRKKGTDIGIELRVAKLGFEVLLKLGARHVMAATLHVFRKGMNDPARIGRGHFERRGEVEQVTALYTLVKRAAWFRASDSVREANRRVILAAKGAQVIRPLTRGTRRAAVGTISRMRALPTASMAMTCRLPAQRLSPR